ncbi:MAG: glycosyltransferase family 2 protein [Bacteroidales bacterium]|jgi:glycosyltransferase involved in cell wall biosynthesis|nr:glycosyltransferase family 2 protein [Bacteroidales bacterium]MCI2121327.1 glycosyltransferase family 2 protein [Bacteroidales bacterium]MCI2145922.1 glycosyltransferase family 2 protein [Bacteroidales bacterium]
MTEEETKTLFREKRCCVIVPTYNNAGTVMDVVTECCGYCDDVFVVNDGSTDGTLALLEGNAGIGTTGATFTMVSYEKNRGKGYALRKGFEAALEHGFDYAVTIDSDGQHFPSDLPAFAKAVDKHPGCMIVGSRNLRQKNMPTQNTKANKISNFWFTVFSAHKLPDTQTGYRAYPIRRMEKMRFFSTRYEAELEILLRCTWRGIEPVPIPVQVYYAPKGIRVTHYRKFADTTRITLLDILLLIPAILYGYPSMLIHRISRNGK